MHYGKVAKCAQCLMAGGEAAAAAVANGNSQAFTQSFSQAGLSHLLYNMFLCMDVYVLVGWLAGCLSYCCHMIAWVHAPLL